MIVKLHGQDQSPLRFDGPRFDSHDANLMETVGLLGRVQGQLAPVRTGIDPHTVEVELETVDLASAAAGSGIDLDFALQYIIGSQLGDRDGRGFYPRAAEWIAHDYQLIRRSNRLIKRLGQRAAARVMDVDQRTGKLGRNGLR